MVQMTCYIWNFFDVPDIANSLKKLYEKSEADVEAISFNKEASLLAMNLKDFFYFSYIFSSILKTINKKIVMFFKIL